MFKSKDRSNDESLKNRRNEFNISIRKRKNNQILTSKRQKINDSATSGSGPSSNKVPHTSYDTHKLFPVENAIQMAYSLPSLCKIEGTWHYDETTLSHLFKVKETRVLVATKGDIAVFINTPFSLLLTQTISFGALQPLPSSATKPKKDTKVRQTKGKKDHSIEYHTSNTMVYCNTFLTWESLAKFCRELPVFETVTTLDTQHTNTIKLEEGITINFYTKKNNHNLQVTGPPESRLLGVCICLAWLGSTRAPSALSKRIKEHLITVLQEVDLAKRFAPKVTRCQGSQSTIVSKGHLSVQFLNLFARSMDGVCSTTESTLTLVLPSGLSIYIGLEQTNRLTTDGSWQADAIACLAVIIGLIETESKSSGLSPQRPKKVPEEGTPLWHSSLDPFTTPSPPRPSVVPNRNDCITNETDVHGKKRTNTQLFPRPQAVDSSEPADEVEQDDESVKATESPAFDTFVAELQLTGKSILDCLLCILSQNKDDQINAIHHSLAALQIHLQPNSHKEWISYKLKHTAVMTPRLKTSIKKQLNKLVSTRASTNYQLDTLALQQMQITLLSSAVAQSSAIRSYIQQLVSQVESMHKALKALTADIAQERTKAKALSSQSNLSVLSQEQLQDLLERIDTVEAHVQDESYGETNLRANFTSIALTEISKAISKARESIMRTMKTSYDLQSTQLQSQINSIRDNQTERHGAQLSTKAESVSSSSSSSSSSTSSTARSGRVPKKEKKKSAVDQLMDKYTGMGAKEVDATKVPAAYAKAAMEIDCKAICGYSDKSVDDLLFGMDGKGITKIPVGSSRVRTAMGKMIGHYKSHMGGSLPEHNRVVPESGLKAIAKFIYSVFYLKKYGTLIKEVKDEY